MRLWDRLLRIDRRWIFALAGVAVTLPILVPLGLPIGTTPPTQAAFDFVEGLKPGDVVWLSFDYGPSSAPENDPMAEGFLRHCLSRDVKVVASTLFASGGLGLANRSVAKIAAEFPNKMYGVDYVNLGFKAGNDAVMRRAGQSIPGAFPTDVTGRPVGDFPIFQGIRSLRDVKLVFTASTGDLGEYWVTLVNTQYGIPVIVGPTAVSAPKFYAYLASHQLTGMLGGMKGAAEYEQLLGRSYPALGDLYRSARFLTATKAMDSQTGIHFVIVSLILIGNAAFFMSRLRPREI